MFPIKFEVKQMEDITVLSIYGRMDSQTYVEIREKIMSIFLSGAKKILVDLGNVHEIVGSGWDALIHDGPGAKQTQADVRICGMNPKVREMYDQVDFSSIITSAYATVEEAVKSFK